MTSERVAGSFRDPAGCLFRDREVLYRAVMPPGRAGYQALRSTGLYDELTSSRLLIPHEEVTASSPMAAGAWLVLQPELVPFVSYPHEWAFSALKDAALLTLDVQRRALARGLWLKDASAFNVQFIDGRPIFIDTLSFEPRRPGGWPAYQQFCRHFLAPLLLMARTDVRLGELFQLWIDGIPLPLASRLLPAATWLRAGALLHVHLHARAVDRTGKAVAPGAPSTRDVPLDALADSLGKAVSSLQWAPVTQWSRYETEQPSYSDEAMASKVATVSNWIERCRPRTMWDLGANTGRFSRLAAARGIQTVALDQDAGCVERLYQTMRGERLTHLLPLVSDLTRPMPGTGWANRERQPLSDRGRPGLMLALALVHHLAIGSGIPLPFVAAYLAELGEHLIIEFIPKDDPLVATLLANRQDVFADYSRESFEIAFARHFTIRESQPVLDSGRVLYLMTRS